MDYKLISGFIDSHDYIRPRDEIDCPLFKGQSVSCANDGSACVYYGGIQAESANDVLVRCNDEVKVQISRRLEWLMGEDLKSRSRTG